MTRKGAPTRRQGDARRAQAANGEQLRGWLSRQAGRMEKARAKAAEKREKARAKEDKKADGVTRVEPDLTLEWVHQHHSPSRAMRRIKGRNRWHGRKNTPYRNPDRDAKSAKSGRLRKELLP